MKKLVSSFVTLVLFLSIFLVLSIPAQCQEYEFILKWGEPGTGPGQFLHPAGIAVDSANYVYVTDRNHPSIQKFDTIGTFIAKWGHASLLQPIGVAVDSYNNVYVASWGNADILKFDSNGGFITRWHTHSHPSGIAVDSNDNVYVSEPNVHFIQKFDSNGNLLTEWGSNGCGDGELNTPFCIAVDSENNVFVTNKSQISDSCTRIQKFDSNGGFITKWGRGGSDDGEFDLPRGIAVDSAGDVYLADYTLCRISKFARFIVDIKANGSDAPITITQGDPLSLTLKLDAGIRDGEDVDCWILMRTSDPAPNKWYYFDMPTRSWALGRSVTRQGSLFDINSKNVPDTSGFAPGTYVFFFAVDMDMNGAIDVGLAFYDKVKVTINP